MKNNQFAQQWLTASTSMLVLFFALNAAAQSGEPSVRYVRSAVVNLRAEPNATSMSISKLRINTKLSLMETHENFCRVSVERHPETRGFVICSAISSNAVSEKELDAEFVRLRAVYQETLNDRWGSTKAPLSETKSREAFLADPREFLAVLERRFYFSPGIESLAWYGTVAEDVAYMSLMRNETNQSGDKAKYNLPWLSSVKTTWKNMLAFLEGGWEPGEVWPLVGTVTATKPTGAVERAPMFLIQESDAESAVQFLSVLKPWLVKTRPSLFKQDERLHFFGAQPPIKKPDVSQINAEPKNVYLGWQGVMLPAALENPAPPLSGAGMGFRNITGVFEWLKQQPTPLDVNFYPASDRYGIEGLLNTSGVSLKLPKTVHTYAVTDAGLVEAKQIEIGGGAAWCGEQPNVKASFTQPLKKPPLVYFSTMSSIAINKMRAKALAELHFKGFYEFNGMVEIDNGKDKKTRRNLIDDSPRQQFKVQGKHIDLDGDGIADLLITNIWRPQENAASSDGGEEMPPYFLVYANIGGDWQLVAESVVCGGC
jgi:hypothetical protein